MSNLGQHDGDGIRYAMHLSAPKGGSAQMLRDPAGGWVSWADYAHLKAEVEELRLENQAFQRTVNEASAHYDNRLADISRLKAEVERLTEFTTRTIIPNEELQAQVEQLQNRCDFLEGKHNL